MIYTGIGSRKTPGNILHAMVGVAEYLGKEDHTLRSGGAQGADRAFEIGADRIQGKKMIYLPTYKWNKNESPFYGVCADAQRVASLFHPRWEFLTDFAKKLMGRNAYQILGHDLQTKTDMVICWTPKGEIVGGTGQALRMAVYYGIPVFNLGADTLVNTQMKILHFLEGSRP